jgi:signal peptidase I
MRRLVRDVVLPVMVAVVMAFVVQAAVAKPYEIPTESMVPTIAANDRILVNRLIYRFRDPVRGDIVVFTPPPSAAGPCSGARPGVPFVKRVVGVPGDRVDVRDGKTFVNGEPFVVSAAAKPRYNVDFGEVPENTVLVLGDNRNDSCDAHDWVDFGSPFVPLSSVIGQVEIVYYPFNRVKFLD